MQYANDEVFVETETLANLPFPKSRFSRPVRIGVFFLGYAPEEQAPQAPAAPSASAEASEPEGPAMPAPTSDALISFPDLPDSQCPPSIKNSVRR